jgi:hypothetical protein
MLIEEEPKDEPKIGDINPEALEAVFAEESDSMGEDEDVVIVIRSEDEDANELDIAFYDDEDQW